MRLCPHCDFPVGECGPHDDEGEFCPNCTRWIYRPRPWSWNRRVRLALSLSAIYVLSAGPSAWICTGPGFPAWLQGLIGFFYLALMLLSGICPPLEAVMERYMSFFRK